MGYRRPDGQVGIRNHVLVIPANAYASTVAERIARLVPGVIALAHPHGDAQHSDDTRLTEWTLAGAAANPNVCAALIVGLDGERGEAERVLTLATQRSPGKRFEAVSIQDEGGSIKAIRNGCAIAKDLLRHAANDERSAVPIGELILATQCGGSDSTSGMASNPTVGVVSDLLVEHGGTTILAETPELMGAEHILARRARDEAVAQQLVEIVANVEKAAQHVGATVAGGNPTPGNVEGGLTTIEEKSLGCIYKGGSTIVEEVIGYADHPTRKGLIVMDTPGHDPISISGELAGGAQVCIFTTGRGSPVGNALGPVIKVTANPRTAERMSDNMDFSAAGMIAGAASKEALGQELFELTLRVASGELTRAEIIGHTEFALYRIGPQV
ncbi:MAG: hypothetical protein CL878_13290 [Dehalococcoidia bacterium]|nr:hypothetical protein [Dehalococcoidia bacterium]